MLDFWSKWCQSWKLTIFDLAGSSKSEENDEKVVAMEDFLSSSFC